MQISKESRRFCKPLQLNTVCVYGGTGISEQIAELKRGAEIIVCTPGRMIDMLAANGGEITPESLRAHQGFLGEIGVETKCVALFSSAKVTLINIATFPLQKLELFLLWSCCTWPQLSVQLEYSVKIVTFENS